MIACSQKALVLLVGIALAFSLSAEATQVKQQVQSQSEQDQDKQVLNADDQPDSSSPARIMRSSSDDDDDEDVQSAVDEASVPVDQVKNVPTYQLKVIENPGMINTKKQEDEDEDDDDDDDEDDDQEETHMPKTNLEKIEQELSVNLHKQKELKHRLEHLTDQSESDQEIDESAKMVANETQSEAMGDTLGQMWKEMRMFEVPEYAEYAKDGLHHLKQDEKNLESDLTAEQGKLTTAHGKKSLEHQKEEEQEPSPLSPPSASSPPSPPSASPSVKNAKPQSVWEMSHMHQNSVFMGSLVYLVGGILIAVLFNQVRAKKYWVTAIKETDAVATPNDFAHNLFGCHTASWKLCLLGFCCPCLAWANTLANRKILSYWKAFTVFFLLMVLYAYPYTGGFSYLLVVILGTYYRQKIRNSYEIESRTSTIAMDFVLWWCCQPCAIIQEAREEGVVRKSDSPV